MSSLSRKYLSLLALLGLTLATAAGAAQWSVRPVVDQDVFYDGNITLGPVFEEEVHAYRLAARTNLRGKGDRWQADLNAGLIFTRLSNQLYDSDDQLVDLALQRFSQTVIWRLDGEVRHESTRTLAPELDFVLAATRVEKASLRPSWTRIINEKNSLTVGANWMETDYDALRFNDYEQLSFDATWIRSLGERLKLELSVYDSSFESGEALGFDPGTPATKSDTLGLTVGLTREFDEQLSGSISLGSRRVDTITRSLFFGFFPITNEDESSGFTTSAGLNYSGEIWNAALALSRTLNPSGFVGELVESDRIAVEYERQLRPRLYLEFKADYVSEESLDASSSFERERLTLSPALRWQFLERWSLTMTPRGRTRDTIRSSRGSGKAESLGIFFRVRYAHPRTSW